MSVQKKKQSRFYGSYISKLLKEVSPKNGITSNARQQLNSILRHLSELISQKSEELTLIGNKRTISVDEVVGSVQLLFPDDLSSEIIHHINESVERYRRTDGKKGSSRQVKAGLIIAPSITEKFLRNFGRSKIMLTQLSPIAVAAAIEVVGSALLRGGGQVCLVNKKIRITVRDLELSSKKDTELNELFLTNKIIFIGGGTTPFIHPSLQRKKNRVRKKKQTSDKPTKHRFKPGTVALRKIRKLQKIHNCLILAKTPFEKMIRGILGSQTNQKIKVSKVVFTVLQYYMEARLVEILKQSNLAAIHAGRVKVLPEDIDFVMSIRNGTNPLKIEVEEESSQEVIEDEEEEEADILEEEN